MTPSAETVAASPSLLVSLKPSGHEIPQLQSLQLAPSPLRRRHSNDCVIQGIAGGGQERMSPENLPIDIKELSEEQQPNKAQLDGSVPVVPSPPNTSEQCPELKKKTRINLKQFSIRSPLDEPSSVSSNPPFHFHGPKSVRHWINKRRHHEISDDNIRSYVKGKVIDRQHELFIMSIAIMLGMRTSIGRTNMQMAETSHDERRWLDNDDLMAVEKYIFPPRVSLHAISLGCKHYAADPFLDAYHTNVAGKRNHSTSSAQSHV
jgi:hypothetical protein